MAAHRGPSILEITVVCAGHKIDRSGEAPSREQADALNDTLRASNTAANEISEIAWRDRSFGQYKLHKLVYHPLRVSTGLTSQLPTTVDVEDPPPGTSEDWIGVDLGIAIIATDSDGEIHASEKTEKSRKRYERIRSRLQAAGTKSAKRHLKTLAKRERSMKKGANHVISKRLVSKAAETNRGTSLEDLQGIRKRTAVRKAQRSRHGKWALGELRTLIEYKARLAGVALAAVPPRNTSRSCSECGYCDKANRRSRSEFVCKSCGYAALADENAALNIRSRAVLNQPTVVCVEVSLSTHSYKPTALAVGS
jgi:putative transposase